MRDSSPEPRAICSACGVVWAREASSCAICESTESRPWPETRGYALWVAAFATFRCRMCGDTSRMQGLETDCKVECAGCGQLQLLDPEVISDAMELAWEVADHAARGPFGEEDDAARAAMLAAVGRSTVAAEVERSGVSVGTSADRSRNVHAQLAPGHPLCETCREPVEARIDGGRLVVGCARCGASVGYALPESDGSIRPFPRATLDGSLREGAVEPAVEEAPGDVAALRCPVCSAGLAGVDGRGLARCGYCKTVVRVAQRLRGLAGSSTDATTAPYWMLFDGPSPARQRAASRRDRRARKQAEAEARLANASRESAKAPKAPRTSRRVPRKKKTLADRFREDPRLRAALSALVLIAGAAVMYGVHRIVQDTPRGATFPQTAAAAAVDDDTSLMSTLPEPPAAPRPPPVQTLPSFCGCPVPMEGGGTADLAWGVEVQSMVRFGADVTISVAYSWIVGEERSPVVASDQTAPPNPIRSAVLELAVACDDDAMLVTDGRYLTRWSLSEKRVTGSVPSPSPFAPRTAEGGVSGECYRAEVRRGVMTFEDAGGFAHRIRVPRELR